MSTPSITPSIIDLCSLDDVKDWLKIDLSNTDDDSLLSSLITGFSQWILTRTGIQSFNSVQSYDEIYDGNGYIRMFLNNRPINAVSLVQIGNFQMPQSTGLTVSGFYIEQSKKSIAIRAFGTNPQNIPGGFYGFTMPFLFVPGNGNIEIKYTAGYTRVPFDLQQVVMRVIAINYRRKDTIDLASKTLSAGGGASGTTRYRDWAIPPEDEAVINHYARYARP